MTDMTITEFLTARLDEDEASARARLDDWDPGSMMRPLSGTDAQTIRPHADAQRALREVEAKRAIVLEHWDAGPGPGKGSGIGWCGRCDSGNYGGVDWPCPTIRALAAVYADHPDYHVDWRP